MKIYQKLKIAVAMSGGVDSSVAAKILKDEGHNVVGLFLKLWSDPTTPRLCGASPSCSIKENRCCDYEALDDARTVASKLGIPFYVINARDEFKKEVVDYFLNEYKNLCTPNPCVVCNDKIKFGLLLKRAMEIGCDKLAMGHYARIARGNSGISNFQFPISNEIPKSKIQNPNEAGAYKLLAGVDETKDQSYMLYHLNQKQLSHVLFPLGEMTKKEVRELAKKWDLSVKEKPESQEICFFGDRDYRSFLKRYLPEKYFKHGEIVDRRGNILGEHQGLTNYTIGQRKGIEQSQTLNLKPQTFNLKTKNLLDRHCEESATRQSIINKIPLYVIDFDIKKNQLIVGEDKEVYAKAMIVSDINWVDPVCHPELVLGSLKVKIRYRHEAVACKIKNKISKIKDIEALFDEPQRAVTPGQSAVFYLGDEVLGGGIIR